jgi:hypothetical protein
MAAPGYGPGNGAGCGGNANCAAGSGYGPGSGMGGGMGMGYGRGGGRGGAGSMMTEEERAEHRAKMHSFESVDACTAYWTQHRAEMVARAQAQGITPGPGPRVNPCERMAARGLIK